MAKVIIFGVRDFAQLARFYLKHDSPHDVVAFSVNEQYLSGGRSFEGLPVAPFENIEETYPPGEFSFFAPLSPSCMNRVRESIYQQIRSKGYKLVSYVSSRATVFSREVGDNCFILEDNTIQPFTSIGNNIVLWSGNHVGHHSVIKDHVTFTSHVVLSGHCIVEPFSFFGVNATIRDSVHIGEGSFIAMSASVTRDTEPWSVYKGNPAQRSELTNRHLGSQLEQHHGSAEQLVVLSHEMD